MNKQYGYIYRHSDYKEKDQSLIRAEKLSDIIKNSKEKKEIGEAYLEMGLIHFRHGDKESYEKMFHLSIDHHAEAAFTLMGLLNTVDLMPDLSEKILNTARTLDTGIHEDGSMESAIPYLENIVNKSDFIYSGPAKKLANLIEKEFEDKNGQIVDIGTGPGPFAIELRKRLPHSFNIVGYDVSKKMLDVAKGRIIASNLDIDLVLGPIIDPGRTRDDFNSLPFDAESVDILVSHGSMHHWGGGKNNLPAVEAMLNELNRILKPGGRMFIYDINPIGLGTRFIVKSNALKLLNRKYQHEAFAHSATHSLNKRHIKEMLGKLSGIKEWDVYPAVPFFPTGLIFHVIEIKK